MAKKSLRRDQIIDRWLAIVDNGAGQHARVISRAEQILTKADLPNVSWKHENIRMGIGSQFREFLVVSHRTLSEFVMYLSARDYGQHLDCAWFLTLQPGFMQKTAAKFAQNGSGGIGLNVFDEQDLSAWISVTHRALTNSVKELMEELEQDFTGMNTRSKGYLSVW